MKKMLISLLLITLVASVASADIRAWYKFDETSGTTVADSSGNGFDATATGITTGSWETEGAVGGCLNNYIANNNLFIPVDANVFSTMDQQGTFAFWVMPMEPSSGGLHTGGWFTGTDSSETKVAWARPYQLDDYARFSSIFSIGSSETYWWSGYNDLVTDKWNHFAVVFDAADGTRKVYCNGGLIVDSNTVAGDTVAGIDAFNIFHANSAGSGYWDSFHGKMDDFRIYDHALTAQDVADFSNGYFEIAKIPSPSDGSIVALGATETLTLQWQAGLYAASHDVYLGTDFNDVNNATNISAEYVGNQIATEYSPNISSGIYYWRVDEVNDVDVWKGDVWSFDFRIPNIDGALIWYKFDETSDVNVADSSGNGYDATATGITSESWDSEGADGGCLNNHITGNNLYIPVPTGVLPMIDQQATFAFWVQLTELSDDSLWTGGFFTGANAGGTNLAFARPYKQGTGVYPGITLYCNLGTSTTYAWWSDFDDTLGERDEWGHIAMTFDAVAGTKNLYVNGQLIANYSSNQVLPTDSLAGMENFCIFSVSAVGGASWDSFHGKMDDFRIYPRSLMEEEVSLLVGDYFKTAKRPSPEDGEEGLALTGTGR